MKILDVDGEPAMALFALRPIAVGDEVLYNYGVSKLPWKQTQVSRYSKCIMLVA